MAHIGMIRALEENNIPIDYITGTSMGHRRLIVCHGILSDEMHELISSDDFRRWYTGSEDMSYRFYFKQSPPTPSIINVSIAVRDSMTILRPLINSVIDPLQMNRLSSMYMPEHQPHAVMTLTVLWYRSELWHRMFSTRLPSYLTKVTLAMRYAPLCHFHLSSVLSG